MESEVISLLDKRIPGLLAIYLFGSRNRNDYVDTSDLDLAILTAFEHRIDPVKLLEIQLVLADHLDLDVDLIDLREVKLDFKYIILSTSKRIYCCDEEACDFYEMTIYSMYQRFEIERQEIINDIRERGFIYGR